MACEWLCWSFISPDPVFDVGWRLSCEWEMLTSSAIWQMWLCVPPLSKGMWSAHTHAPPSLLLSCGHSIAFFVHSLCKAAVSMVSHVQLAAWCPENWIEHGPCHQGGDYTHTNTHTHAHVGSLRQEPLLVWCYSLNAYLRGIGCKQEPLLKSPPDERKRLYISLI